MSEDPKIKKVVTVKKAAAKPKKTHEEDTAPHEKPKPKSKKPIIEASYGTGRRKTAIARVYIIKGSGKIDVNSKPYQQYFCNRPILIKIIDRPLKELNLTGAFDIKAAVHGGGITAQADAVRMGIARALVEFNPENRIILRKLDLLKRDPRAKERKKYGLKRARKAFQYSKR